MSTLVRKIGTIGASVSWAHTRTTLTTSTGGVIVIVADNGSSTAALGHGTRDNVGRWYVYESTDRTTWTLRATINFPTGMSHWNATIYPDNSIGIVAALGAGGALNYYKMTYGTYAVSAAETVHAAITATEQDVRLDVMTSDSGVPFVVALRRNTTGSTRLRAMIYVRRADTGAWTNPSNVTILTNVDRINAYEALTSSVLKGGSASSRRYVFAVGTRENQSSAWDAGVLIYTATYNETTGAQVTAPAYRWGVAADSIAATTSSSSQRVAMMWPTGTNEFTMGVMHSTGAKEMYALRGTWDGTTFTDLTAPWPAVSGFGTLTNNQMAMSYGANRIVFHHAPVSGSTYPWLASYVATFAPYDDDMGGQFNFKGHFKWDNQEQLTKGNGAPSSGTGRHTDFTTHDTTFVRRVDPVNNDENEFRHHYAVPTRAPAALTPAAGSTTISSLPPVTANADLDLKFPQSRHKITWQFASDSAFTTNLRTYVQPDSKFVTVYNTDVAGTTVKFTDTLPGIYSMPQGSWFVRAAHVDEMGNTGAWTAGQAFSISHPPSAGNLKPSGAQLLQYGTGEVQFTWTFSDPSSDDYQTAYRVVVENNETGAVVLDSGKVSSVAKSYIGTIPAGSKDLLLRFRVALWDRDDVQGSWSSYSTFMVADPPSVAVSVPTNGAVLTSPVPTVEFTPTVGGARTIRFYRVIYTQGSLVKYDSGDVAVSSLASGTLIMHRASSNVLSNAQAYSVQIKVTDSTGMVGSSAVIPVTTAWTPPVTASSVSLNAATYTTDGQGYVTVAWSDAGRDDDFSAWVVYRKDDLLSAAGVVVEQGTWKEIGKVHQAATSGYIYRDFYAPAGHKVNYRVEQLVNRFGDELYSSNGTAVSATTSAAGYWLIEPEAADQSQTAFRLYSVTSDDYTEEYEEESYVVIGRGRHVDRGERLGIAGSLVAQIRDGAGLTARQHKRRLELMKSENRQLFLRTPFGDIFRVSVGNLDVSRVSGVGTSEFVDVTIPYLEVGE